MTGPRHIFHLSDLHIRHERILEYTCAFDRAIKTMAGLINYIKNFDKEGGFLIIITGDIFHAKITFDGSDVPAFYKLIAALRDLAPVIIIAGNHDVNMNLQTESRQSQTESKMPWTESRQPQMESRQDLIKNIMDNPFIENGAGNKVMYWNKSGYYKYEDLDFGVISVIDSTPVKNCLELFKSAQRNDSAVRKIGLFHRQINNKSGDTGDLMKFIDSFDIVLAGDLHKRVSFGSRNQGMYAGPLFQQTIAEDYVNGFLWWNISNKKPKIGNPQEWIVNNSFDRQFIAVPNDYCRISIKIADNGEWPKFINLPPIIVRARVSVNTNIINQSNLAAVIKEVYGCKEVQHAYFGAAGMKFDHSELKTSEPEIKEDFNFEEEILNVRDNLSLRSSAENILELHNKYIDKVAARDIKKSHWSLLKLEWNNILCFDKNNIIDFSEYNGTLAGIFAENKMGKTSIIDIISLVLFNVVERGSKDDIISDDSSITATLRVGADTVIVDCSYFKKRTDCKVIINGINNTCESLTATYKYLESIIGSYENYTQMNVIKQGGNYYSDQLIHAKAAADRREIIYDMFNLSEYKKLHDMVKHDLYNNTTKYMVAIGCESRAIDNLDKKAVEIKKKYNEFYDGIKLRQKTIEAMKGRLSEILITKVSKENEFSAASLNLPPRAEKVPTQKNKKEILGGAEMNEEELIKSIEENKIKIGVLDQQIKLKNPSGLRLEVARDDLLKLNENNEMRELIVVPSDLKNIKPPVNDYNFNIAPQDLITELREVTDKLEILKFIKKQSKYNWNTEEYLALEIKKIEELCKEYHAQEVEIKKIEEESRAADRELTNIKKNISGLIKPNNSLLDTVRQFNFDKNNCQCCMMNSTRVVSFSDDINKYQAAVLKYQEDVKRLLDEQQKVENILKIKNIEVLELKKINESLLKQLEILHMACGFKQGSIMRDIRINNDSLIFFNSKTSIFLIFNIFHFLLFI